MNLAALIVVMASGIWLIAVALLMAARPRRFLELLSLTASNWRINFTEQGLRLLAGLALIIRGEVSKTPAVFLIGGWFIVVTSMALWLLPLRWHAQYAIWWSGRMTVRSVQAIAPLSAALGAWIIYAAM